MFNFLRSIGSRILSALSAVAIFVLDAAFAVVCGFPHHPLNSTLVSRLKMLYLVPTAIVSILVIAAFKILGHLIGVVVEFIGSVFNLVMVPVYSVLRTLGFLVTVAYAIVVKVPQFAYALWTHKPLTPFEVLVAALRNFR